MSIVNITRATTLASYVEIADNPAQRMKGLLGRSSLAEGYALVITGCNSIHMLFMKFPIDVVFLDKKKNVVGIVSNIKPFQFSPIFWKAACAVELPVGIIASTKTQLGDQMSVTSSW